MRNLQIAEDHSCWISYHEVTPSTRTGIVAHSHVCEQPSGKSAGDSRDSVLHVNARPHVANSTAFQLQSFGWEIMEHSCSSDLAPSDYHVLGPLKKLLAGQRFISDDDNDAKTTVWRWFRAQPVEFYNNGISRRRLRICFDVESAAGRNRTGSPVDMWSFVVGGSAMHCELSTRLMVTREPGVEGPQNGAWLSRIDKILDESLRKISPGESNQVIAEANGLGLCDRFTYLETLRLRE
ncbi:hypothetical protein ANN_11253 [Periplaneta americana]|uniref:Uncharacterized protein n=1 Tax=Periplaneta americana TaxID=6978 RepID=A0ABQ8T580_PERAM|nr:hypothetical protein ANN_11253 [Periplaneta americana]